ncbi:hypothetical protein TorRG33x02_206850 [Trema orientale]|uniref:Uncharacterized protein n=1 Tax=Trema orientale TaxID=63057 RepID=A0A2P5EDD9_TREOI|nr:hypothetical protein TorRG33x02_206850 [Trema orientale]
MLILLTVVMAEEKEYQGMARAPQTHRSRLWSICVRKPPPPPWEDSPLNPFFNAEDPLNLFLYEQELHPFGAIHVVLIHEPEPQFLELYKLTQSRSHKVAL